jgi:hypothetical protein
MNLLRYANASIRNTSLLSLDAKATYILPFLLQEMSQLHDVILSKDIPSISKGLGRI